MAFLDVADHSSRHDPGRPLERVGHRRRLAGPRRMKLVQQLVASVCGVIIRRPIRIRRQRARADGTSPGSAARWLGAWNSIRSRRRVASAAAKARIGRGVICGCADDPAVGEATTAERSESIVSPNRRIKRPTPPPRVRPPTPVWETTPAGTTKPWACAPRSTSPSRAPPPTRTRLAAGSTITWFSAPEVDHDPAVDSREPGQRVPAAADRDRQPVLPAIGDRGGDVLGRLTSRDHRRPAVVHHVPDRAHGVEVRRLRADRTSLEAGDDLLFYRAHVSVDLR